MNNSKKLKAKKVKVEKISKKPITSISKPWLISSLVVVVLLIGALIFDQLYEAPLMKIDGKNYHLNDLSYYIYNTESQYSYYTQLLGSDYLDTVADESTGLTYRQQAKNEAVQTALKNEVLYNEAIEQGYSLTDEEKATISTSVDNVLANQMSAQVIKKNDFTKKSITNFMNKGTLASRYTKDIIETLDIDDAAIEEGISFEDYRQYDIQTIFIATQKTDDSGNTVDLSADEKTAAYEKISALYESAKSTEDWSTLIPEGESELIYKPAYFIESEDTYSDEFEAMMVKMANGDISNIYEDATGYYIVRMVDNSSKERYNSEVETAITNAENTAFQEYYTTVILPKHSYKLNQKELKKLQMGSVTM